MPELLLELLSEEIPARMQARAAEDLSPIAEGSDAGQALPSRAVPAHDPFDFAAALDANQGGDGLDVVAESMHQRSVINDPAHGSGKRRVVLCTDRKLCGIQLSKERLDERASRAFALGEQEEPVVGQSRDNRTLHASKLMYQ